MADFDPDAYLAQFPKGPGATAGSFDPDKYLADYPTVGQDVAKSIVPSLERGPMNFLGSPQAAGSLVDRAANWVQQHTGFDPTPAIPMLAVTRLGKYLPSTETIEKAAEPLTGKLYEPKTAPGRIVGSTFENVSNPASYIGGGGLLQNVGRAALSGAGAGVGEEVAGTPGAVIGGLAGAGPDMLKSRPTAGSVVPASRQAAVDTLNKAGVFPRAGDVLNNDSLRFGETSLGALPGAFNAAKKSQEEIGRQFTSAVLKQGIGEDADLATPEVINRARDRLGATFERIASELPIQRSKNFGDAMGGIFEDLMKEGLPNETVRRIDQQMKNVLRGFDPMKNGKSTMSGDTYQALTRKDTPLARAIDDGDPNVSYYATRIRGALDDAMDETVTKKVKDAYQRGKPGGKAQADAVQYATSLNDLKEARRQWYNHIIIGRAAAGAGEDARQGMITPARLQQVLTGGSPDRQLAYARGKGAGLQDLAKAGNQIMEKLPNSRTAERTATWAIPSAIAGAIASGHPLGVPAVFAPGLTGKALLSKPVQNYLINRRPSQIAARMRQAAAPAARSLATNPYLIGATNPYSP